ncbi:hypothetical protein [Winogradskyella schleiferi]|uniref:hypothetical protein n=1 Tax=Winogradskyella schleiferi TaxID=2686078 RepID=UPI0015BAD9A4|nr:hypothetical protein [Winogradskyella schleiferi]
MKTLSKIKSIFTLLLCVSLFNCSSDDSNGDNGDNGDTMVSYAEFSITGPITEGNYNYRDSDDEFGSLGFYYDTDDDPDLSEDQIQVYVGKSFSESHFILVAPPEIGSYNFVHQVGVNSDLGVSLVLSTLEDNFSEKDVTVTITELEINGNTVTHCKGTFSGSFYRSNLVEADVHQISGEFEIH